MRNHRLLLCLLGLLLLGACNDNLPASEQALEKTPENTVRFEQGSVTDANASVQAFADAREAFEKGNLDWTAEKLQEGIDALKNEGQSEQGKVKTDLDKAITKLMALKEQVQQGRVTSIDTLMNAISEAELLVPHRLLSGYQDVEVAPVEE